MTRRAVNSAAAVAGGQFSGCRGGRSVQRLPWRAVSSAAAVAGGQFSASTLAAASCLERTGLRMTNWSRGAYTLDPAAAP